MASESAIETERTRYIVISEIIQQFANSIWQMFVALLNPFFLVVIAILLIILVLVNKKYKAGAYYQITKVPLLLLSRDVGRIGEYLTYKKLQYFEKDKAKFLFNVYIPKDTGETTEIDVLMLTRKGIFVFESKNYSGWIFGSESQKNWYQTLPAGRGRSHKEHFYNPIMQNSSHIKYLRALIGENIPMHSIIVFSERCTLKNVTVKSDEIKVIKRNEVSDIVFGIYKSLSDNIMTDEDVENLFAKLYPYTQVSEEEKAQHIANIQNKFAEKPMTGSKSKIDEASLSEPVLSTAEPAKSSIEQYDIASDLTKMQPDNTVSADSTVKANICPKCGGELVLRTATKGVNAGNQFWGCTNFPKCRHMQKIEIEK